MKVLIKIGWLWIFLVITACLPASQATPSPITDRQAVPTEEAKVTATIIIDLPPSPTTTEALPTATEFPDEITFTKTFGGKRRDRGINLLQTSDGGYAVLGYTSSQDAILEDVYLVRTDPEGEILWERNYGGDGVDNGWAVLETGDHGFIIAGFTNSYGSGEMDIYLLRTDAQGNLLWERTFGGEKSEYGWAMAPTSDGGYVLAGQTDSFGQGDKDGYLVKVNDKGDELWSQTFGGPGEDRLYSIDEGEDNGFILTGTTKSFGPGNRNLYLVKTTSSGELDWEQVYGEDGDDVGHAVRRTGDGGYIVTGYTQSFGAANYDTRLIKTNEAGDMSWQTFYGEAGDDRTIYGEQTENGGYILTGYTKSFGSVGWDVVLVRTDASGEVLWHKTFGGKAEDTGYTVRGTSDSGFILTGETYSSGEGGGDMLLIKVNQDGEITE